MTLYSKLGSKFLLLLTGRVVVLLVGLATMALLTRELGPTGFGVYRAAIAYLGLVVVLCDLGLASIFVRDISREGADQMLLVGSLLLMRLSISALVMIAAVLLSFIFKFDNETRAGILLGAIGYVAYSAHLMLFGLFQQKLKQHSVLLAEVVGALLFFIACVLLRNRNVPASEFVGLFGACYVVTFLITLFFANRLVPIRLAANRALWRTTLQAAMPLALARTLGVVYVRADIIVLALLQTPAAVGIYGVPIKISDSVMGVTLLYIGLMAPPFARSATRDHTEFAKLVSDALGLLVMGIVGGSIIIFMSAEDILRLLGGSEFVGGVLILRILVGFFILDAVSLLMREAIVALGAQAQLMPVYFLAVVIAAILYALLIPAYGGVGAAATLAATTMIVALGVAKVMQRHARVHVSVNVALRALLCGGASLAVSLLAIPVEWGTWPAVLIAATAYLILLVITRTLDIARTSDLLLTMLGVKSSK